MVVVVKRVDFFSFFCGQNFLIVQSEKVLMIFIHFFCVSSRLSFKRRGTLATKLTFNFQLLFHHFVHEIVMSFLLNFFFTTVFCTVWKFELLRVFFTKFHFSLFNCPYTSSKSLQICPKFQFFNFSLFHTRNPIRERYQSPNFHTILRGKIFSIKHPAQRLPNVFANGKENWEKMSLLYSIHVHTDEKGKIFTNISAFSHRG